MNKGRLVLMWHAAGWHFLRNLFSESETYRLGMELFPTDVLIFGGGTDINPRLYGQSRIFQTEYPDVKRDQMEEIAFHHAQKVHAACFGICRGSQFLTAMSGGELFQHVTGHGGDHPIELEANTAHLLRQRIATWPDKLFVTSTHHQMMNPFKMPVEDYKILAFANPCRSNQYLVGPKYDKKTLPAIGLSSIAPSFEPEIVYYPKTRSLAIQGHPEFLNETHPFSYLSHLLVEHYLLQPF